jgi:hypothetical protein
MKQAILILTLLLICLTGNTQPAIRDTDNNSAIMMLNKSDNYPVSPLLVSNDEKQIKKGDLIVSGSASLYFSSYNSESGGVNSNTSGVHFGIYPGVLFFVSDGLAIGTSVTLGFASIEGNFSYNLGIGPEFRYYFDFGLFMKAKASYLLNHYETSRYNSINIEPAVGYAIFLNPHVALEPCFFYNLDLSYDKFGTTSTSSNSHFVGFEIGFSIFL